MTGIRVNIIAITVSILTASLRFVFFISDLLFDNIILRLVPSFTNRMFILLSMNILTIQAV